MFGSICPECHKDGVDEHEPGCTRPLSPFAARPPRADLTAWNVISAFDAEGCDPSILVNEEGALTVTCIRSAIQGLVKYATESTEYRVRKETAPSLTDAWQADNFAAVNRAQVETILAQRKRIDELLSDNTRLELARREATAEALAARNTLNGVERERDRLEKALAFPDRQHAGESRDS